ncbi:7039_t:CDS:2 [Funneliformis geosporum]|uniref:39_t:CDS:1 n=1 Tax=Funneliformis geosporum TaxID=1117311 RepID=A0A9W4SGA9_9GLOM|nr:7039_t:CDS:2 [Funneliformis geosporum]CAI2166064.1 39_t:CDS:2 [Funneliformis geosporum]
MFLRQLIHSSRLFIRRTSFSAFPSILIRHKLRNDRSNFHFVKKNVFPTVSTTIGIVGLSYWYVYNKNVALADAPQKIFEPETTEEPESKVHIPTYISLHDGTKARLVGLGIRTVSFLKMKVYVVGMYIRESDIDMLKKWKGYDKEKFMSEDDESMALSILDQPIVMAIRIEPVRNTSGHHLRDGFSRTITHRMQNGFMSEEEAEDVLKAIRELQAHFPKSVVKTGTALILTKETNGILGMEYEGKYMGSVNNVWLTNNIFMGYLAAKDPISKKAKKSIADGFEELLK